jgi:hypothetical protein
LLATNRETAEDTGFSARPESTFSSGDSAARVNFIAHLQRRHAVWFKAGLLPELSFTPTFSCVILHI